MMEGTTQLTRTPAAFSSAARTSVSLMTPAFAMAYAAAPGSATKADREETLTMPPAFMRRAAARHDHHADPRLRSIITEKSSGVVSATLPGRKPPVALTTQRAT